MSDDASVPSRPASPVAELPNFSHVRPYRFTWDPSTRKPGPASVSGTTEGRGDYFGDASPYELYNHSSLSSLPLGALPPDWSSARHGFHAISTVVNSPHKRSAPPKAHSSLPAVPPAELPRVRRKDFDPYLSSVGTEWERFQKNAEQGREGAAQIPSAFASSSSSELPGTPLTPRIPAGRAIPPLESVPSVFFEPEFNLGDPRTFNAVTEQGDGTDASPESDPSSLSYSLPLLEKLSHHADTIEQHLVREISVRSTSFFAALSNLQDLQTESEQCLDRIAKLRGLLKEVDEKGAHRGLEVVRKEARLRNMEAVREGVRFVGGVVEMTGVAKSLVAAGQWGEALDVIDELDRLWEADSPSKLVEDRATHQPPRVPPRERSRSPLPPVPESPPESPGLTSADTPRKPSFNVPLSSLRAFASLPEHLRTLTMQITSSLTSEFVNVLRLDLVERIDADGSGDQDKEKDRNMSLKDRLRPLLQSLARTKGVREAAASWREVVMAEVRSMLRRRIPASNVEDDEASSSGSEVVNELRAMSHAAFMDLAHVMYGSLMRCIEGLNWQNAIILEVLQSIRSPKAAIDSPVLQEELSGILSSASELAHVRASRVVALRAEQHAALDLPSFCALFNESWTFVIETEKICRRMIVGLRGTVVSQAKSFLQTYHQAQISHSAKLVEDEQWNAAEVAPSVQRLVDLLVDASISDPPELLLNRGPPMSPLPNSPAPPSPGLSPNGITAPPHRPSSPLPSPAFPLTRPQSSHQSPRRVAAGPSKHLRIEDRSYFAVSATLEVLVLLVDYLKIIANLEMLTTETMSRVIELLKSFNSRTCQVVLGAGAMRSAGLKNITARHLALASQSLSIVISLVPYIRETFRRHLSQRQAVMLVEFDKLKRDYQEHQNEIHQKLIAIMGDRLSAHIKSLQDVKWDAPKEGGGVNDYMEVIVKDTVTLHKVLSRYLSPSVVEYVMTQVFAGINHRLSDEYTKIELPSAEAKDRLLADARYLHQKLTGLKNVGAPTAMLEIIVSEKPIARPDPPPAPTPAPATQRIKGILSRSDSKRSSRLFSNLEKALPSPTPLPVAIATPTPDFETPLPQVPAVDPMADNAPAAPRAVSPAPPSTGVVNGMAEAKEDHGDDPPHPSPKSATNTPQTPAVSPPSTQEQATDPQKDHATNGHAGGGAELPPPPNGF